LLRTIQRVVEDPLAEEMLSKKYSPGAIIGVDYDESNKKLVFGTKSAPAEKVEQ